MCSPYFADSAASRRRLMAEQMLLRRKQQQQAKRPAADDDTAATTGRSTAKTGPYGQPLRRAVRLAQKEGLPVSNSDDDDDTLLLRELRLERKKRINPTSPNPEVDAGLLLLSSSAASGSDGATAVTEIYKPDISRGGNGAGDNTRASLRNRRTNFNPDTAANIFQPRASGSPSCFTPDGTGSCDGRCGSSGDAYDCFCDDLCLDFGDCCCDANLCIDASPCFDCAGTYSCATDSCAGRCGDFFALPDYDCYCDNLCLALGDCCDDYDYCSSCPTPSSEPSSDPSGGGVVPLSTRPSSQPSSSSSPSSEPSKAKVRSMPPSSSPSSEPSSKSGKSMFGGSKAPKSSKTPESAKMPKSTKAPKS